MLDEIVCTYPNATYLPTFQSMDSVLSHLLAKNINV